MINEKLIQKSIYTLQKALQVLYFFGSLWLGLLFVITIPVWAPLYLLTTSMCRSLNFLKRVIDLPRQVFRPEVTQPIRYAIIKANGRYLRNVPQQYAFLYQLYDYTLRKFLSVQQISCDKKIAEIECESLAPWKYFKSLGVKNIVCLQSKIEILEKERQKQSGNSLAQIQKSKYDIDQFSNNYDIITVMNLKEKLNKHSNIVEGKQIVDVIKVLGYLRHHIADDGYVVFGDFFQEQGEVKVLEELFNVYGFGVEEKENIQKNVQYAEKLMNYKTKKNWQDYVFDRVVGRIKKLTGIKRDLTKKYFMVFILKKLDKLNNNDE